MSALYLAPSLQSLNSIVQVCKSTAIWGRVAETHSRDRNEGCNGHAGSFQQLGEDLSSGLQAATSMLQPGESHSSSSTIGITF